MPTPFSFVLGSHLTIVCLYKAKGEHCSAHLFNTSIQGSGVDMLSNNTPTNKGGLYIIKLSDKHYYGGRSMYLESRWGKHLRALKRGTHGNPHMQSVYDIHGVFEPSILKPLPLEQHVQAEQEWLDEHFGKEGCVNLSSSALGIPLGYKFSEEVCAKHRRPVHTLESKELCRQASYRRKTIGKFPGHTEQSKENISKGLKKAWKKRKEESPVVGPMKGKKHSEEARKKMSEAKKGKKMKPHKKKGWTEERKRSHSKKMREFYAKNPQAKKAKSEQMKGRPPTKGNTGKKHSEETKQKMRDTWARKKKQSKED